MPGLSSPCALSSGAGVGLGGSRLEDARRRADPRQGHGALDRVSPSYIYKQDFGRFSVGWGAKKMRGWLPRFAWRMRSVTCVSHSVGSTKAGRRSKSRRNLGTRH